VQPMRISGRVIACIAAALVFAAVARSLADDPAPESANPAKPLPKITISKETTYITEPLRADGYPDYVAAVNQHCSKGVTPENNAAIPFWQAVGPKGIDKKIRKRYFEMLGIAELPEEGDYLDDACSCEVRQGAAPQSRGVGCSQEYTKSRTTPWTATDYPAVAQMLAKNQKPLDAFVHGMNRSRFYSPIVEVNDQFLGNLDLLLGVSEARTMVRMLVSRAMLRLGDKDIPGAWNDLLACCRFVRVYGERPLLADRLIASSLEGIAGGSIVTLSGQEGLTSAQARQFLAEYQALPPARPIEEVWEYGERIFSLACLVDLAAEPATGLKYFEGGLPELTDAEQKRRVVALKVLGYDNELDWNEALRRQNRWSDGFARLQARAKASGTGEELARWDDDSVAAAQKACDETLGHDDQVTEKATPAQKAERLVALLNAPSVFGPISKTLPFAGARIQTERDLALLALALGGYHADRGVYPTSLTELSPSFVKVIPKDRFTGGELRYAIATNGYLLYSVGPNGEDDGGRNFNDQAYTSADYQAATEEEKARDDIAIRMPPEGRKGR
jgi:hypothetical protein